ncbi:MAG TPA: hypothetical protein VK972_04060, partial [Wenzhouxiangella sp.]|nr:hypothetical protein [Wenzhouxiangella sp.]
MVAAQHQQVAQIVTNARIRRIGTARQAHIAQGIVAALLLEGVAAQAAQGIGGQATLHQPPIEQAAALQMADLAQGLGLQ